MAETTGISWTHSTFNPWIGCTKVGPGCDACYAEAANLRFHAGTNWGAGAPRRKTKPGNWGKPLKWNKEARALMKSNEREHWYVFCASQADVFDNEVPQAWRDELWSLIRATPYLTWQIVTKRIGNAPKMLPYGWGHGYKNVWLISTIVNQEEADRDIPKLLSVPAVIHGISYEPALGPVDWSPWLDLWCSHGSRPGPYPGSGVTCSRCQGNSNPGCPGIDWIIVGGESAQPNQSPRPFVVEWAINTIDQCKEAGAACFVKQLGSLVHWYGLGGSWPSSVIRTDTGNGYFLIQTNDRKGADPEEWQGRLRVQEFPK